MAAGQPVNIDTATLRLAFDVVVALAVFANFWWSILDRKSRATAEQLAAHRESVGERFSAHGDRLTRVESVMTTVPTHQDLARIHESVRQLEKTVNTLVGANEEQTVLLRQLVRKEINSD